ncbi:hypothetical protein DT73_02590 [Mangrovibacter sp. MFB070]|uniref:hypothetical protein n=1 Tax=Mangrovibacter sp. MFB070 TaxID=1224318 RepID=UPI0004D7788C|nr:hypothetical protein [Mangrovibacter sp. MFB070]KEA54278.1 hypothetical protein DT73_02590 [Mangrovibacter sp. MFB070]
MPQRLFLSLARYLKHGFITPVLFLAACWLVGNAPLAQASESSPGTHLSAPVTTHYSHDSHNMAMLHTMAMRTSVDRILCEKDCHPDYGKLQHHKLQPEPVAMESGLLLVERWERDCVQPVSWHVPPSTGPPAEIRFCRFRE